MNPILINPHLARDCSQVSVAATQLQSFSDRLQEAGATLPGYLYVRPLQAEIVFTRPALPRLTQLFGREGWKREAAGVSHFDWTKRVQEGVTLRVSECEEVTTRQTEVSAGTVASLAAAERVGSAAR